MARYEFKFPDLGEGLSEAELINLHVKVGDQVKEGDTLMEVQTAKANVEIPSPVSGTVAEIRFKAGDTIHVGDVVLVIETGGEATLQLRKPIEVTQQAAPPPQQARQAVPAGTPAGVRAMPAARRLAKEAGIDLGKIRGSGPGGVITVSDVKKAQEERQVGKGEARTAEVKAEEGREERLPVKGIRKTIAEKMSKSKGSIPHAYHMEEIDMTEVARIREELKRNVTDVKITFLHFVMKAVATALGEYPLLNASFDEERNEIVVKHYVNLGVAVDTDQGLVVVVVKNADGKSLAEIAGETARLAEKARAGKLELGDVMGSTFTISNIGAIGGVGGLSIINAPEGAIMAMGRIVKRPVVGEGDEIRVRQMMMATLSFDHRITDGAYAARFMNRVKELLENPYLLLARLR
ncbi:dihydrolipoamide acetyltransferase component of pyruvate dehydrogenase complex [Thermocladium modestius]|uniref:Dihydrolipoamide acetyltransferase component of pyruvate dehydrogenase complex n=1 Tax=Thermocladium modestius TaxID=62609 RepID=A0A830GRV9_9CREN|nr:dihydrolipoamide acetyltransferase family protein [Thermocladium modestius]GGP19815.1 dihydrolipoamide acetyltransferase component of pyruvate dehydrogenase complex [Thermocladium modestius]